VGQTPPCVQAGEAVTLLQRLRVFLGLATAGDERARHAEMLRKVQDAINEYDRRDTMEDTLRERPSKKRW
jgi:hypothetical protein